MDTKNFSDAQFTLHNPSPRADWDATTPHMSSDSYYEDVSFHKKNLTYIVTSGLLLFAAMAHFMTWDKYSLSIIPLKMKQFIGATSAADLRQLGEICDELLKHDCSVTALSESLRLEPSAAGSIRLAQTLRKLDRHDEAIQSYNRAFQMVTQEGAPADLNVVHFGLARSYEALNQREKAVENYELAIQDKPEVIQITVTQSYIRFLKSIGQTDRVEAVIAEARHRSGQENLFADLSMQNQ